MDESLRVFIGSSSEGLHIAEVVHGYLKSDFRPVLWKHGLFVPSTYPMEVLEQEIRACQFAVIIGFTQAGAYRPGLASRLLSESNPDARLPGA